MNGDGGIERAHRFLTARAHGRVRRDAPLAPWTSYQLGGPAGVLLEAAAEADLEALSVAVRETGLDVLVVGRGSNMLVSDRGFPGIAVRLGGGFRWTRRDGGGVASGAAVPLPALAGLAQAESLAGLEFAVAIPASVGGAVRMNAGAHGHSMSEVLEWADAYLLWEGRAERLSAETLVFDYRTSSFPPASIVTAAGMRLSPGEPAAIAERMREAREWRRRTQPTGLPNAGSVFKNPPGDAAGRLIDEVCGKGMRAGGARISEVHANFIVTEEGAHADDVYTLIRRIQRMVRDNAGLELEPEVKLIGAFEEAPA